MADYLKKLNDKVGNDSENQIKLMYTCSRENDRASGLSDFIGFAFIILIIVYVYYRFKNFTQNPVRIFDFAKNQEILKMFIGLLLLSNIKNLSNSLIGNLVLPIVKPILPMISCNLSFKMGTIELKVGNFVSDSIIFAINLSVVYLVFMLFG